MAIKLTLNSNSRDVAPGTKLSLSARVFDSVTGKGAQGMSVKWTIAPSTTKAKLESSTSITSVTGYASNTVICDDKAAVTVTATLDNSTHASDSLDVGFHSSMKAPTVPQARNGILTEKEVNGAVQSMVGRHTDDPTTGDLYNFYWGSNTISRIDDGTADTFPWVINIKKDFAVTEVLADGNYEVYYTVTDMAQNVSYSIPLAITVTGGAYVNPLYDAPEFIGITDNTINADDVLNREVEVNVAIPQSRKAEGADIFAGNIITLYMRVFDKDYKTEIITTKVVATYTVTDSDIKKSKIHLILPKEEITDDKDTFDDVRGQFWYTVTGTGSVSVSGSSFTKKIIIDTVPPHIPQ